MCPCRETISRRSGEGTAPRLSAHQPSVGGERPCESASGEPRQPFCGYGHRGRGWPTVSEDTAAAPPAPRSVTHAHLRASAETNVRTFFLQDISQRPIIPTAALMVITRLTRSSTSPATGPPCCDYSERAPAPNTSEGHPLVKRVVPRSHASPFSIGSPQRAHSTLPAATRRASSARNRRCCAGAYRAECARIRRLGLPVLQTEPIPARLRN